jgi:MFS family permease
MAGRFLGSLGDQMLSVAVGWELYQRTNSALALGLVGLVQVAPVVLFSLPAGGIADRFPRQRVIVAAQALSLAGTLGLAILSLLNGPLTAFYACLLVIGIGSAFRTPASSALLSQTVPSAMYANAATWSSSSLQLAAVLGPTLGGLVIALTYSSTPVYILDALAGLTLALLIGRIRTEHVVRTRGVSGLRALGEGISFVARTRVVLGAITLDMFGVLLGGATSLLPIYARDILYVGPQGLGWLAAAPSVGAILMAVTLAHLPPFKRAGAMLLVAVVGFGAATIVFGLSTSFPLSLVMLALLGAFDNISMVIRHTLLLVRTPDELRGRVSAVNNVFIGASNQLGGFESGVAAALFTPVIAVVGGGVGTILIVLMIAFGFPELRRFGRLTDIESERSAPSVQQA